MFTRICPECRAVVAEDADAKRATCCFCDAPLYSGKDEFLRTLLLVSSVFLGVALVMPPWGSTLHAADGRILGCLPIQRGAMPLSFMQLAAWVILGRAAWYFYEVRMEDRARFYVATSFLLWLTSVGLALPPSFTPYAVVACPPGVGEVAHVTVTLSWTVGLAAFLFAQFVVVERLLELDS